MAMQRGAFTRGGAVRLCTSVLCTNSSCTSLNVAMGIFARARVTAAGVARGTASRPLRLAMSWSCMSARAPCTLPQWPRFCTRMANRVAVSSLRRRFIQVESRARSAASNWGTGSIRGGGL